MLSRENEFEITLTSILGFCLWIWVLTSAQRNWNAAMASVQLKTPTNESISELT